MADVKGSKISSEIANLVNQPRTIFQWMPYRKLALFRIPRAREASLGNTLLRNRLGESIQQQPPIFIVEFSTQSAKESQLSGWHRFYPQNQIRQQYQI